MDSQLGRKAEQKVKSIQEFARIRLGLRNSKTLQRGGRTASSYIAKMLEASVERLTGLGVPIRLIIDRGPADFRLTFQRLQDGPNQVIDAPDEAADLLRYFAKVVHGTTTTRRQFAAQDRKLAETWIRTYGLEASQWMAKHAANLLRHDTKTKAKAFRALELYTDAARGAWERRQVEDAGQQRLPLDTERPGPMPGPSYEQYVAALLRHKHDPEADRALAAETETSLKNQIGSAWKKMGANTRRKMIEGAVRTRRLEALDPISSDVYEALDRDALGIELKQRHGLKIDDIERS